MHVLVHMATYAPEARERNRYQRPPSQSGYSGRLHHSPALR